MASYALSGKAEKDILAIARNSIQQWGMKRAQEYILGLHDMFEQLATFPDMGRDASIIRPGYMQMESFSHVVFYRKRKNGVLIVRVLHERMNFEQHL